MYSITNSLMSVNLAKITVLFKYIFICMYTFIDELLTNARSEKYRKIVK